MHTVAGSIEFQNLMSSRMYAGLESSAEKETGDKVKIRIMDLKDSR